MMGAFEEDDVFDADEEERSSRKGAGGKGRRPPRGGGSGGGGGKQGAKGTSKGTPNAAGLGTVRQHAFKVLCTDILAANLIGSKGSTRAAIEAETGCSVWISKREEVFPAPPFRILVLHGDAPVQVQNGLDAVVANLAEVAARDRERDPDSPLLGKEPGELAFHVALPTFIMGKLIGSRGANIQKLREQTGAHIFVENEVFDGHKSARIIGMPETICDTLRIVSDLVQEEAGSEEYVGWAAFQPFRDASGKGKGGPRDGHSAPEPRARNHEAHGDHPARDRAQHESRGKRQSPPRRSRSRRRGPRGGGLPFARLPDGPPLQRMERMARDFGEGELELNHAVSCTLPSSHMDTLLENKKEYITYVERQTNTSIKVSRSETDGFSDVMITGPLLSVYAAHMAVMKTFHDKEREAVAKEEQKHQVEELEAQLANLESQLRVAQQRSSGGGARPTSAGGRPAIGKGRR